MLGFVGITVVAVKCGRNAMAHIAKSVLDVPTKYVVVAVSRKRVVIVAKQIAGFAELTIYLSVGV
jgi:hypothetical protein